MTTSENTARTDERGTATNRGCRFSWCEDSMSEHQANGFEHWQTLEYVPATGNSLQRRVDERHLSSEYVQALGVGVRFNEDLDPAPKIALHATGGPQQDDVDYELRIDEAVLLYDALSRAIKSACEGTNLSPRRIMKLYSPESQ